MEVSAKSWKKSNQLFQGRQAQVLSLVNTTLLLIMIYYEINWMQLTSCPSKGCVRAPERECAESPVLGR